MLNYWVMYSDLLDIRIIDTFCSKDMRICWSICSKQTVSPLLKLIWELYLQASTMLLSNFTNILTELFCIKDIGWKSLVVCQGASPV